MIVIAVDGRPEYHTRKKKQARKACFKNNAKAKPGQGKWEMWIVRPLPDVDLVMAARIWDKIRCPGCGSILNTDGNLVTLSGKSMKVEFSDYSKLVSSIKKLQVFHVQEMSSSQRGSKHYNFHLYAKDVLAEILGTIETVQGAGQ